MCTYVNFTRHRKLTLCTLGLLGYTDRKESANEKRRKESKGLLLPFLSPLIGSLRYGDYGLRTTDGRALSFVRSTGLSPANIGNIER